jgi:2'-5' RNA ligase
VTASWRCFVAVPIPASLCGALSRSVSEWRADPAAPDLRWTPPEGWHLTVAFLGAVDPDEVPALVGALQTALEKTPAWRMETGGLGTFPGPGRARVVWYGVADADGRLAVLAHAARLALVSRVPSLRDAQPFRAHVTLARARNARGVDLVAWLSGRAAPSGVLPVRRVVLYRSVMAGGRPPRYEALGTIALSAPRGAIMDAEAEAPLDG